MCEDNITLTKEDTCTGEEAVQVACETDTDYENLFEKKYFDIDLKDMVFAIIALLINIAGVSLSLWGGFKSGFTVSYIMSFTLLSMYFISGTTRIHAFPLVCAVLSVLLSATFSLSSNMQVAACSLLAIAVLCSIWFASLNGKDKATGDTGLLKMFFETAVRNTLAYPGQSLRSLIKGEGTKKRSAVKIITGLACALPVLFVIIPLLISSDAAFEALMSKLFGNAFSLISKIAIGAVVTVFFISYAFGMKKTDAAPAPDSKAKGIESIYTISFLSALSVCYIVYLVSQLSYFFSAFSGILPADYDFTVSAYARRGFFEMCAIAAINIAVIYISIVSVRKSSGKPGGAVRLLNTFIAVFTLIIISTALSKMVIYIQSFGMTLLRITTSAFMVFLAAVTISLIARCYSVKPNVLKIAAVTASCILIILGMGNVNRFVAAYNYSAYKTGALNSIDVFTIADMGDAGVEYLILLENDADPDTALAAHNQLVSYIRRSYSNGNSAVSVEELGTRKSPLGSWNYTRAKADAALKEYMDNNRFDCLKEKSAYEY